VKKDTTVEAYDKIAEDYRNRNSDPFYVEEYGTFCDLLGGKKRVLEVGCGIGRDAAELIAKGCAYTGIDASWGMLALARERVPEGDFKRMDFRKLEFSDDDFDGFWAAASLLHVPKNEVCAVFSEIKRILVPGGIGFVSVKEKTNMDEGFIREEKAGGIERYFSFYDKDEFETVLKRSGFEILRSHKKQENDPSNTVWLCFFVKKIR